MLEKKKLRELSKNLISDPDDYMNTFRDNVRMYIDQKEITIAEVAELADVPESTLKSFIYGKSQDCNLSTAVKLSRVFDLSVDEMVGCGTIVPQTCESLQIMRTLPESFTHFVRWAIHYHKDMLESNKVIKHAVEIMNAEEADDGNLKMTNNFDIIDISGVNQDLFPKIFMGIRIPSNRFAPKYFEGEIILLANDRDARESEPVVVSTNDNLWIFKRKEEVVDGEKKVHYYSIRDGKLRATCDQIPMVIGYVAKTIVVDRD
ncbi:MAG: helix-turn-helix transcriptional regulator [Lachnospiraceae bacterium]|nr:helix-turn-helix transcriptional regulator [Lachnospiraceae bacterium]